MKKKKKKSIQKLELKINDLQSYFTQMNLLLLLLGYLYFGKLLFKKVLHVYQNKLLSSGQNIQQAPVRLLYYCVCLVLF